MWRKLSLSTLLVLAVDVGGAVIDAPWVAEAAATCKGCDPRIKRGKLVIKKKRIGTVVKLPPVPPSGNTWSSEGGPPTDGVSITVAGSAPVTAVDPIRAVTVFSGSLPEGTTLADYTLRVELREQAAGTPLVEDFQAALKLEESGETVSGSSKVMYRALSDGTLQFRVRNEDRDWDPTLIKALSLVPVDGPPVALTNERIEARFFAPLPADFVFDTTVAVKAQLLDEEGAVIQTVSRTLSPPSDSLQPTLDRARLSETRRGDARLATWTLSDGEPVSLDVVVTDDATGERVIDALDEAPVRSVRVFTGASFTFEGGEDPAGTTYLLQLDAYGADGEPVGDQHEVELTMPARTEGETAEAFVTYGGADALGVVGIRADDTGFTLVATSEDDTVTAVQTAFLEPFEGPAPLAVDATLDLAGVYQRWVQKGSGPLPASCTVASTLVDVDDAALDLVTVSGVGAGNVYSNGKGTSTATSAALRGSVGVHLELL